MHWPCSCPAAWCRYRCTVVDAGQASLSCASIAIGGLGALDEPLSAMVVQSPSSHCTRLLATADLHAAASRVQTKPAKTPNSFLVVKFGRGSANADNHAVRQQGKKILLWEMLQPLGMEIDVEAAGIEVSSLQTCYMSLLLMTSISSKKLLSLWIIVGRIVRLAQMPRGQRSSPGLPELQ